MTRGEKNNNPGNVRIVPGVTWLGQSDTQADESFVQFKDPAYGIRAIVRIMRSYKRQGLLTLSEAIDRWAPPNENNSEAYVTSVCTQCGLGPDDAVDFDTIMPQLVSAIIRHENSEMIYMPAQIADGIALA